MSVFLPHKTDAHFAAIDLGSNTCRLLIARSTGNTYKVVETFSRVVRLGTGLKQTGYLSEDAMNRAIDALKACARRLKKYTITGLRCVATEACRQAQNREDFFALVQEETGIELEVISEYEEGRLALLGCQRLITPKTPYVLGFDIGGCSTEVMWAKVINKNTSHVLDWRSLPYGVVNVLEACGGEPDMFYDDIRRKIKNELEELSQANGIKDKIAANEVQVIGSSGTTTTVAAIHQELPYYDRGQVDGYVLPYQSIQKIAHMLIKLGPRERADHPCIGPSRSDMVLGGIAILQGICDIWPVETIRVADRGVRDGIIEDLWNRHQKLLEKKVVL